MKRVKYNKRQRAAEQAILQAIADCAPGVGFEDLDITKIDRQGRVSMDFRDIGLVMHLCNMKDNAFPNYVNFNIRISLDGLKLGTHSQILRSTAYLVRVDINNYNHISNQDITNLNKYFIIPYLQGIYAMLEGFQRTRWQEEHKEDITTTREMLVSCATKLGFEVLNPRVDQTDMHYININISEIVFSFAVFIAKNGISPYSRVSIIIQYNCFKEKQHVSGLNFSDAFILGDGEVKLLSIDDYNVNKFLCELYAWAVGMVLSVNLFSDIEDGTV